MVVAFVGSDSFEQTPVVMIRLYNAIKKLIVEEGSCLFFFTNVGTFDFACWQVVSLLKTEYPNIKRIYAQTGYESNRDGLQDLELCYDKILDFHSVCETELFAPYVRNRFMIGLCDVLVTYFDAKELQRRPRIESLTESTIKYAKRFKRRIIDLYVYKI